MGILQSKKEKAERCKLVKYFKKDKEVDIKIWNNNKEFVRTLIKNGADFYKVPFEVEDFVELVKVEISKGDEFKGRVVFYVTSNFSRFGTPVIADLFEVIRFEIEKDVSVLQHISKSSILYKNLMWLGLENSNSVLKIVPINHADYYEIAKRSIDLYPQTIEFVTDENLKRKLEKWKDKKTAKIDIDFQLLENESVQEATI